MKNKKQKIKKAMIIGKTELYDFPEKAFDLISCLACQKLFIGNVQEGQTFKCPHCKERIEIIKNG